MSSTAHSISIARVFDAPRDLVFRNWVRAEDVGAWFAPEGFTVTRCEVDARPGGRWQVEFRSAAGDTHREYGEFREIVEPERLSFTLTQQDDAGNTGPQTLVTVAFVEQGSKTEMTFEQTGFGSAAVRDGNAEGWKGCFAKLDEHLAGTAGGASATGAATGGSATDTAAEEEIRREFEEWFADAAAKDLDAVMAKIAADAVSYEHETPLVYRGTDAIREVCRRGFDAPGFVSWDIPDLQVVVRDDIAVTWGLNRMRVRQPGGDVVESWSRGTRVFQKLDGRWKMIHQHVSFPYEPETGRAKFDG